MFYVNFLHTQTNASLYNFFKLYDCTKCTSWLDPINFSWTPYIQCFWHLRGPNDPLWCSALTLASFQDSIISPHLKIFFFKGISFRGLCPMTPHKKGPCPLDPRGCFAPSNDLPWRRPWYPFGFSTRVPA